MTGWAGYRSSNAEQDAAVERLREFVRLNYVTGAEVAKRIGFRDKTVYSWLAGKSRPAEPELAPTGYEYREYKNWRGIPKPRRCPFCKRAKGEIRKARGGFYKDFAVQGIWVSTR
jgi:hypothetical protein